MSIDNAHNTSFPAIETMLSSVIRVMINYIQEPDVSQFITLVRILGFIKNHPDFKKNDMLMTALEQLMEISKRKLVTGNSSFDKNPKTTSIH